MKRLIAMLMALVMSCGLLPVCADGADLSYERVVAMAQYMRELTLGDYLAFRGAPEHFQRTAREWAAGLDGEPRLIVKLDVSQSNIVLATGNSMINEHPMVAFEAESSAISHLITYTMFYAARESVIGEDDFMNIPRINSLLNGEMIYAEEATEAENGTGLYIAFYEDAEPLLILASAENGAVSLMAVFLPGERLARCADHGQVAMWFMMNGLAMTCSEVTK